jgi:hypothetical protein
MEALFMGRLGRRLILAVAVTSAGSIAQAGDFAVLAFDLVKKVEVSATAHREGGLKLTSSARDVTLSIKEPSRQCTGTVVMKPEVVLSTSREQVPTKYVDNRPVGMATTKRTNSTSVTGHKGLDKITCSDDTVLVCEMSAGARLESTFDGECASLDGSVRYRVVAS